jgi:retron-type reverse transcriptase
MCKCVNSDFAGATLKKQVDLFRDNLRELHARIHQGTYRALPSRRRYIPKPDGRQRPLGIAALEDKIAQRAVVEMLNAIYEEDFLGFSYTGSDLDAVSTMRWTPWLSGLPARR